VAALSLRVDDCAAATLLDHMAASPGAVGLPHQRSRISAVPVTPNRAHRRDVYSATPKSRAAPTCERPRRSKAARYSSMNVKLPTGYRIIWAGEFEELQQAKARLMVVVPVSLALILLLLYALFNSVRDSLAASLRFSFPVSISASRPQSASSRCSVFQS
jgi:AcrB/AcrD/AcrF family